MEQKTVEQKQSLFLNDQEVVVTAKLHEGFKTIDYNFSSNSVIEPITIAVAFHILSQDICKRQGTTLEELQKSFVDNEKTH